MYTKTVPTIWHISPADLVELNGHLILALGEQYEEPDNPSDWQNKIRYHIGNIVTALQTMHRLGCPMDSTKRFIEHRWDGALSNHDVRILTEANASLYWIRGHRNHILN